MANNIAIGDVYEVKAACYCNGQASFNVRHFVAVATAGTGGTDAALATQMDTLLAPAYKPAMGGNSSYYGVRVQRLLPLPKTAAVVAAGFTGIGTGGPAALPTQVCGVGTLLTSTAGRKFRGRVYAPFPASALNDAVLDTPTAAYKAALLTLLIPWTSLIVVTAGVNTTTMNACIFHRSTGTTTIIAGPRANQKWGTQRRRGNYGQPNVYPPF